MQSERITASVPPFIGPEILTADAFLDMSIEERHAYNGAIERRYPRAPLSFRCPDCNATTAAPNVLCHPCAFDLAR